MSKFREFIVVDRDNIEIAGVGVMLAVRGGKAARTSDDTIHVIEYAALEAERERSKKLVEALEKIGDEVGDSQRRDVPVIHAIIEEALKSYKEGAG